LCQSLYDENQALSARITSIVVTHYSTNQAISFSTHAIAEELGIAREHVIEEFDKIEATLLNKFYSFVQNRRDKYWVHWNMRSLAFGFEHVEHRYRVLSKKDAPVIPVERQVNLNDMIADRYGSDYAPHQKMINLMEMNGGRHRDLLTGPEEVQAFKNREFIRLHRSNLCKTGFFSDIMEKMLKGKLKTQTNGIGVRIDRLLEGRTAKTVALSSSFVGVSSIAYKLLQLAGAIP
jgi:hypothetical protein